MGFFDKFFSSAQPAEEQKSAMVGSIISSYYKGQVVWTPRNYEALAKEGYIRNVIAYRCINEIARGAASVPWVLSRKALRGGKVKEVEKHPLLDLLRRPNPSQGGGDFFESVFAYNEISGNAYIEAVRPSDNRPPLELYTHRPDRMQIMPGAYGIAERYRYTVNGQWRDFEVDPVTGKGSLLHLRRFHPSNDWYGLSPLEAAAFSIDQHNFAGEHNASLLQNGARPSGALVYKSPISADPAATKAELERVQMMLLDRYTTPKNAGKPMVLGGDVQWLEMMVNQRDMDFAVMVDKVARNICTAFGVPHVLIIPGESTYNNRTDARLEMWENLIIPTLDKVCDRLNDWLLPMFEDNMVLSYDLDQVSALLPRRQALYNQTMSVWDSGLIKKNEAREALGYEADEDGDTYKNEGNPAAAPMQEDEAAKKKSRALERKLMHDTREVKSLDDFRADTLVNEVNETLVFTTTATLVEDKLRSLVERYGREVIDEVGADIAFRTTDSMQQHLRRHSSKLMGYLNDTTKADLMKRIGAATASGATVSELTGIIQDAFGEYRQDRAFLIARTESTGAAGFASLNALTQAGIDKKEWLTTMDGHARDTHKGLNRQVVDSDGYFVSSSGDRAQHPGGFTTAAENVHCRCAIAAHFDDEEKSYTPEEAAALWNEREEKRLVLEKGLLPVVERIFTIQEQALLKRLGDITG